MADNQSDKAGKAYWNEIWRDQELPLAVDPRRTGLRHTVNYRLHNYFAGILRNQSERDKRLIEFGCGRSAWLPYFNKEFGFQVSGIDYSPIGAEQARAILGQSGVVGNITNADFFDPPAEMIGQFDVAISFGVVEHFVDTAGCIRQFAKFMRPGGIIITLVPNMAGVIGALQKWVDYDVYKTHVPLNAQDLDRAHCEAGLQIVSNEYFMGINWGVINVSGWKDRPLYNVIGKIPAACSVPFWLVEKIGLRIPPNRLTSPYIVCCARIPQ